MMRMPKTLWMPAAVALCLALAVCERERSDHEPIVDTSVPIDLDAAVALFCKEADKKLPQGSRVVMLKKDVRGTNRASGGYIHGKIMRCLTLTERNDINIYYDDDHATAAHIRRAWSEGDVFTVFVRLERWEWTPNYRGFFSMYKNYEGEAVTSKAYIITTENVLGKLLQQPTDSAEAELLLRQAKMGSLSATSPAATEIGSAEPNNARSRASIRRVVMMNMSSMRHAYYKRLREMPGLSGEITVNFAIDEFGEVILAKVVESTISDPELEEVVASRVKRWNFGEIDKPGDITEVTYPFVFSR